VGLCGRGVVPFLVRIDNDAVNDLLKSGGLDRKPNIYRKSGAESGSNMEPLPCGRRKVQRFVFPPYHHVR